MTTKPVLPDHALLSIVSASSARAESGTRGMHSDPDRAEPHTPSALRGTRPGDHIEGPFSDQLAGLRLRCHLSTGGTHLITFGTDEAQLTSLGSNGAAQALLAGIYRARELRPGIYLAHWLNEDRTAHVAMVLDMPRKRIDIGAKLPGALELYDEGTLEDITRESAGSPGLAVTGGDAPSSAIEQDIVGGSSTDELDGVTLGYAYAKSGTFCIRYGQGTVRFGMPTVPTELPAAMFTLPARLRKLQDDLYLAHWFSPDPARTIHCFQVVDFAQTTVYLAALMLPPKTEDFDLAKIALITGR